MLIERSGDLFTATDIPAFAHGCNAQGVMGAGIAEHFRRRYPAMYGCYKRRCDEHTLTVGDVMVWPTWSESERFTLEELLSRRWEEGWVFNLITQPTPGPTADLGALRKTLDFSVAVAKSLGIDKIGMPRIGCGIGGLVWEDVKPILEEQAERGVDLVVYTL